MTDEELRQLLIDLESDQVERKSSFSDPRRVLEAVCAFANDLPGYGSPGVVFIGARDDGSCAGLAITDELLRNLAGMRSEGNILPFPSLTVRKWEHGGCEMAVVIVEPSHAPPVRYRGRTCIRVGPRRAIATAEEELRLAERRRAKTLPFDIQPCHGASFDDLDRDLFLRTYLPAVVDPSVLEENRRSLEEKLRAVRFLTPDGVPTVLGVLVAGKDPRGFIPGSYVQFLRFDGTSLADPVRNEREVDGALPDLLRRLDEILDANNEIAVEIDTGPVDTRRPAYPQAALQQIARNAILHRAYEGTNAPVRIYWFEDRVEIHNPGGPFGQVTPESFGDPGMTDYRNPHIAEALKALGYVQRFGVGIQLARQAMDQNGNPPPVFHPQPTAVVASLGRRA